MMEAVLSNADHPEYGVATIPLPIPRNQYDHCVALLEALEIGDASESDCRLDSLDSAWPVLNQLVCTKVNLDELDYLAKRLDSFAAGRGYNLGIPCPFGKDCLFCFLFFGRFCTFFCQSFFRFTV